MSTNESSAPRKRPFNDLGLSPAPPIAPMFGENRSIPFIFQNPPPQSNAPHPWAPPPNFSPKNAFPQPLPPELRTEEGEMGGGRPVAMGGLRRLFRARQNARPRSQSRRDDSENSGLVRPLAQYISNHYIVNMPSILAPQSDTSHVLLGYLQFFFYLSLLLAFLYLLVQLILAGQRDVEHRIAEYSMDIVQEMEVCATQYKDNYCEANQIPAMIRQCAAWKTCMNRDPTTIGKGKVHICVELIAEVVNGFVESISSWETLVFLLTPLAFLMVVRLLVNIFASLYWSPTPPPTSYPVVAVHQPYLPLQPNSGVYQNGEVEASPEDEPRRRRLEGGQAIRVR